MNGIANLNKSITSLCSCFSYTKIALVIGEIIKAKIDKIALYDIIFPAIFHCDPKIIGNKIGEKRIIGIKINKAKIERFLTVFKRNFLDKSGLLFLISDNFEWKASATLPLIRLVGNDNILVTKRNCPDISGPYTSKMKGTGNNVYKELINEEGKPKMTNFQFIIIESKKSLIFDCFMTIFKSL